MNKQPTMDTLIGSAVYAFAQGLITGGMTPSEAVSHVGFAIIEGTLGRDVSKQLGIPRSTMARWRAQLAEVAQEADDVDVDEVAVAAMNVLLPSLGLRDMRIVQGGDKRER